MTDFVPETVEGVPDTSPTLNKAMDRLRELEAEDKVFVNELGLTPEQAARVRERLLTRTSDWIVDHYDILLASDGCIPWPNPETAQPEPIIVNL